MIYKLFDESLIPKNGKGVNKVEYPVTKCGGVGVDNCHHRPDIKSPAVHRERPGFILLPGCFAGLSPTSASP